MTSWTTSADIAKAVRRRWDDGSLARRYCAGDDFEPISVPVTGPAASQIGDDFGGVQAWIDDLQNGTEQRGKRRYELEYRQIGGRAFGRNQLPCRAVITSWDEAWSLLAVHDDIATLDSVVEQSRDEPRVLRWVLNKPLQALRHGRQWPELLAAFTWLDYHRGSMRYIREVDAPGVDTKFIESHRGVLGELLNVSKAAARFTAELGMAPKPDGVRLRFRTGFAGMPEGLSDATFRVEELARLPVRLESAVIVENEITFLSIPVPENGIIIFGDGYAVDKCARLPFLAAAQVYYWGDIDSHGFAIINRLRHSYPQAQSFLMDAETLHAHRDRWGAEPKPTNAHLAGLNAAEAQLYDELIAGTYGDRLRLEQERIDWSWAHQRFPWLS